MDWPWQPKPRRLASSAPGLRGAASFWRSTRPDARFSRTCQLQKAPSQPWPISFLTLLNMIRFSRPCSTDGEIKNHILHVETSDAAARFISLSARLVRDEQHHPAYIDGLLEDVTTARKQEAGREALIEKLQASLLFLHEPIANLGRDVVICRMDTSIEQLARLMTARNVTAALVASETCDHHWHCHRP